MSANSDSVKAVQADNSSASEEQAKNAVDSESNAQEAGDATLEPAPEQQELPFAIVQGEPLIQLPHDLYIPPDALEVFLDTFEGPLDLLLYLIKRQNLDILDIPIAAITHQYIEYIELMTDLRLELAAEYLVMAAMLAEIKSRMLLPRPECGADDEEDPRAELVRRLQEYERYKAAAENLDALPRMERDLFPAEVDVPDFKVERKPPHVDMREILLALKDILKRAEMFSHHRIERETLSLRERMSSVLSRLRSDRFTRFEDLFDVTEGRQGVVVTFLALLELMKASMLELVQAEPYAPIHVKAPSSGDESVKNT